MTGVKLALWGVPANYAHDPQRFPAGSADEPAGCPGVEGTDCLGGLSPVGNPEMPLLKNPTSCSGPPQSRLDAITHQSHVVAATASMPQRTGCGKLGFAPLFLAGLTTAATHSASGLDLGFAVIDEGVINPIGLTQSSAKDVSVSLPPGLTIDAAATAHATCAEPQFKAQPVACPSSSEVGAFALEIVGYEDPLAGSAYLGTPEPDGTHRLLLTAAGSGVTVKLVAQLHFDQESEQVTVDLRDLPRLPIQELVLELAEEANLLVTPVQCGTYTAIAVFTSWAAPNESLLAARDLTLDSVGPDAAPCPGPAEDIEVSLSPPAIAADGSSTSVATATVTDQAAIAVPGDEVTFSASDPSIAIGPVVDNLDGTYSAVLTSSTAPGTVMITATDESVEPPAVGSATLTQLAPLVTTPILAPSRSARPAVKITRGPPRRTRDRTPTFRFTSTVRGSTFRCKLDHHRVHRCTSPTTLAKLSPGPHAFTVRATDPAGNISAPITVRFVVRAAG